MEKNKIWLIILLAVAVYIVTPNLAKPLAAQRLTLAVNKALRPGSLAINRPFNDLQGRPVLLTAAATKTVMRFDIHDDVTWLTFEIKK